MIRIIFRNFKKYFKSYVFIIIGLSITAMVSGFTLSYSKSQREALEENMMGNPKEQVSIDIISENGEINYEDILPVLNKASREVQVSITGIEDLWKEGKAENHLFRPTPIAFNKSPKWLPILREGRYFKQSDFINKDPIIVIGNGVKKLFFPQGIDSNSKMVLDGVEYKVIGVVGDFSLGSEYESNIFMPLSQLPEKYKKQKGFNLRIYGNKSDLNEAKEIIYDGIGKNEKYLLSEQDLSNFYQDKINFITYSVAISLLCILTSIANISIFFNYLSLKRKRDITISRVIGASRKVLFYSFFGELLIAVLIAAIISFFLQMALSNTIVQFLRQNNVTIKRFSVDITNFAATFLVLLIVSFTVASIQTLRTSKINLSELMKID